MVSCARLRLAVKPRGAPPLAAATGAGVPYALWYDCDGRTATLALDARLTAGPVHADAAPIAGNEPKLGDRCGERAALTGGTRLRLGVAPSAIPMSESESPGLTAAAEAERRFSSSSFEVPLITASLTLSTALSLLAVLGAGRVRGGEEARRGRAARRGTLDSTSSVVAPRIRMASAHRFSSSSLAPPRMAAWLCGHSTRGVVGGVSSVQTRPSW